MRLRKPMGCRGAGVGWRTEIECVVGFRSSVIIGDGSDGSTVPGAQRRIGCAGVRSDAHAPRLSSVPLQTRSPLPAMAAPASADGMTVDQKMNLITRNLQEGQTHSQAIEPRTQPALT